MEILRAPIACHLRESWSKILAQSLGVKSVKSWRKVLAASLEPSPPTRLEASPDRRCAAAKPLAGASSVPHRVRSFDLAQYRVGITGIHSQSREDRPNVERDIA